MTMRLETRMEEKAWDSVQPHLHPSVALRMPSGDMVRGPKAVARALKTFDWPAFRHYVSYENIQVGVFEGDLHLKVKKRNGLFSRFYLAEVDPGLIRYRLDCAYDGTLYHGFQRQKGKPTVQGAIERVLRHITQEEVTLTPSGRTDRGVHAKRQVIHFDTRSPLEAKTLETLVKRMLPGDIEALKIERVPNVFHARFDARMKTYHYTLLRGKDPFMAHYAWQGRDLDLALLNRKLARFVGTHDFAAFGKGVDEPLTRRTIQRAFALETDGRITVVIESEGFLRHMVRYLVGTTVRDIEKGSDEVGKALGNPGAGHVYLAPAAGLTLHSVRYKPDETS